MIMGALTRREFVKRALTAGLGASVVSCAGIESLSPQPGEDEQVGLEEPTPLAGELHEARYYTTLDDNVIQCQMCWRKCTVPENGLGFCRNKTNVSGKYYTRVYAKPCALQIDPIEKEPAFHVLPGGTIFCTGTASCNNRCKHCHNWHMSQKSVDETINYFAPPSKVVKLAMRNDCDAVSFTYNEPTVFYEQMFDTAKLAKESGLKALFHTNGSMNPEPLFALLEHVDAVTVDLKAFTDVFYQQVSSSELWPVLRTLENIRKAGKHLEIVNLVIPTKNDDLDDIKRMCVWIKETLGDEVPLHFTRFSPAYKLTSLLPTPVETLEAAAGIADEEGLQYVYIGNVPGHERNSTFCPKCGKAIISRVHFSVLSLDVEHGKCQFCGHEIPGIWWD
jgi:pyruvate formate lyase activating enzyme